MTLRSRLSAWSLGTLAAVLLGFSASLCVIASTYLHRRSDERLEGALNTLIAAAEVNSEGVEWEPHERRLQFGRRSIEDQIAWRVLDPDGRRIDGSDRNGTDASSRIPSRVDPARRRPADATDDEGRHWRILARRLERPAAGGRPRKSDPDERGRVFDALTIEVGISIEPVRATVRSLTFTTMALSTALWTTALLAGRRWIRGALRPVTEMAEAVRGIGDRPDARLPVPNTRDELEDLALSFNALMDRIQDAFERQRRFTGDASHQLRTPLTAILGHADLALRQDRDADEYRRVLTLIRNRAGHMSRIVESLLFLARADAEGRRPELVPIELNEWLTEHLAARAESPRSCDIRVTVDEAETHPIEAQPALLGELVDNLLDNAAKYSAPGTPITIRIERSASDIVLSIEDRGIGIREADLAHLFVPFFR